jgi:hypothetical protein
VEIKETVDARKTRYGKKEAIALARTFDKVIAIKEKKSVSYLLKNDKPSDDDLAAILLGPSGNLRAPAAKVGKTLIVGFEPSVYEANT